MTREGYLMNYPPHLISDDEMCDAFLKYNYEDTDDEWNTWLNSSELSYFRSSYPLVDSAVETEYRELVRNIAYHIQVFKDSADDGRCLPDWVYSYMLQSTVGPTSEKIDIHDMLVLMGMDNLEDDYLAEDAISCYNVSKKWLSKLPIDESDHRPPTIFGEPHVIKALRLYNLDVVRVGEG